MVKNGPGTASETMRNPGRADVPQCEFHRRRGREPPENRQNVFVLLRHHFSPGDFGYT